MSTEPFKLTANFRRAKKNVTLVLKIFRGQKSDCWISDQSE